MLKALIFFIVVSGYISTAQEQPSEQFHHQIGASGSLISGYGMSYHYIFSDNYRIKLTGLYYRETKSAGSEEDDTYMSIGFEGQKTLSKAEKTRLYSFLGFGFYPTIEENIYNDSYSGSSQYTYNTNTYTGGGGFGVELLAAGRITFNLEIGVLYSFEETRGTINSIYSKGSSYRSEVKFGIGGGLGFGYQF